MEACGNAHHWERKLQGFGHTVRLMAPPFVRPCVKTNKNDTAEAEAICEAVARPNMRFVGIKNIEQQAVLAQHRARQGFVEARTAQVNQIRGLLAEYGLVIPQGTAHIAKRVPELIEDASNELPGSFRLLAERLLEYLKELDRQVNEIDPLRLLQEIRLAQKSLSELAARGVCTAQAPAGGDGVSAFMASLANAWKDGEVRPTHREQPSAKHWWKSRVDPFADAWATIDGWLVGGPIVSAHVLMDRLA